MKKIICTVMIFAFLAIMSQISYGQVTTKNAQENVPGLVFVNRLRPVTFNWDLGPIDSSLWKPSLPFEYEIPQDLIDIQIMAKEAKEKQIQTGFIAQEVDLAAQSIGYYFSGVDEDGVGNYGLRYAEFVVPLTKAIQELSKQNDRLQTQVNELTELIYNSQSRSGNADGSVTGLQELPNSNASLQQNAPNPFSQTTQIKFYLPENIKIASLNIYNLQGRELKQIILNQRGAGSQLISGSEFVAGIYLYALIADGKKIDRKEMILTK
jgi:hypothetical protein